MGLNLVQWIKHKLMLEKGWSTDNVNVCADNESLTLNTFMLLCSPNICVSNTECYLQTQSWISKRFEIEEDFKKGFSSNCFCGSNETHRNPCGFCSQQNILCVPGNFNITWIMLKVVRLEQSCVIGKQRLGSFAAHSAHSWETFSQWNKRQFTRFLHEILCLR